MPPDSPHWLAWGELMVDSSREEGITKQTSLAVALILSFGLLTAKGLCQGAAEYSVTNSHVAAATVKAGSALDKATQKLSGRLQQKLSKSTEESRPTPRPLSRAPADHPVSAAQSIKSAQGMEILYGPGEAKAANTKKAPESPPRPCASSPDKDPKQSKASVPCKPEAQEDYPSVVNLSFGK